MRKSLYSLLTLSFILILTGCSQPSADNQGATPSPIANPGQSSQDTANIKKSIEQNVQNSASQENNKINDATNEAADNSTNNNNMDYVKDFTGAIIKTSLGNVQVKFRNQDTPNTVNNFLKLADQKFYDGTKFHRVIKGFMIQGGDPLSKDETRQASWGTGGPGYKFNDELKGTEKYPQGTLAMANSGPNTNGSQFFIVTASPEAPLPPSYTVFGKVISGMDTALKIENVKTNANDRPLDDVIINSVELVK